MEKKKKMEDEETLFVTTSTVPRFMLRKDTASSKSLDAIGGAYNWFKRKNAYNEDDVEYTNLPEDNMIVATWMNDMGNNH